MKSYFLSLLIYNKDEKEREKGKDEIKWNCEYLNSYQSQWMEYNLTDRMRSRIPIQPFKSHAAKQIHSSGKNLSHWI